MPNNKILINNYLLIFYINYIFSNILIYYFILLPVFNSKFNFLFTCFFYIILFYIFKQKHNIKKILFNKKIYNIIKIEILK